MLQRARHSRNTHTGARTRDSGLTRIPVLRGYVFTWPCTHAWPTHTIAEPWIGACVPFAYTQHAHTRTHTCSFGRDISRDERQPRQFDDARVYRDHLENCCLTPSPKPTGARIIPRGGGGEGGGGNQLSAGVNAANVQASMPGSRVFAVNSTEIFVDGARGGKDRADRSQIRNVSKCLHLRTIRH